MPKIRRLQAKRKVCTTNRSGKKKCFIIKVPRKYKINPEDFENFEPSAKHQVQFLLDAIKSTHRHIKDLDSIADFINDRTSKMQIEQIFRAVSQVNGSLLRLLMENVKYFPEHKKFG